MHKVFKNNKALILILFLALILRVAYFFISDPPLGWSDSKSYDNIAWNLAQGNGYSFDGINPVVFTEPGYMLFFLAPLYFIFGHYLLPIQIFQALLSLGSVFLVYLIGYKFFSKRIGLTASFIYAIRASEIIYNYEIKMEIVFTFLLLLFAYFLIASIKTGSKKQIWLAGLILGLTTITRFLPFFLPLVLLPAFYLIFKHRFPDANSAWRRSFKYLLVLFVGIMIFFTPWIIRNYIHFNTFYFGRQNVGAAVWSGSYIPGGGRWIGNIPPIKNGDPSLNQDVRFTIRDADYRKNNQDMSFIKYTLGYIKENPIGILKIYARKPYNAFLVTPTYGPIHRIESIEKVLSENPGLHIATKIGLEFIHLVVLLFGFIGLLVLFWKKEMFVSLIFLTIIVYFVVVYLPFPVVARYQLPIMPYIIILASIGLWHILDWVHKYRKLHK